MQKKKGGGLKEFYGLCWGGVLRTAYPFCYGSRHHGNWPNGPCWLIRMFHPKWGLIQSTAFPWAREWTGRECIPSIVYSDDKFVQGPGRANGTLVLGYLIQPEGVGHSRSFQAGYKTEDLPEIRRPSLGMWLLATHY